MAYRLTPYDRRVQAELIRKEREARYASRYPTYKKTGAATVAPVEKNKGNGFIRALQTGLDLNANLSGGVLQSVEGLVDLVATGIGAIGGIFSDDFRDDVKDFVATDYTDKLWFQNVNKLTEGSYLNEGKAGEIIEGVAQGVGQMLPDVLLSVATAGAYAGAAGAKAAATAGTVAAKQAAKAAAKTAAKQAAIKAGQRAAMVSLAAHATGSGIQEAFADGASYGEGVAYGALTGATEVATEKLTGGMGRLYGKGIGAAVKTGAKTVGKEVAEVGAKRALKEMAGEGMEEVISEATNPLRKTIYKGKDALKEYSDEEFWGGVLEAGVIGMGTSAAYGGTVGKINKTSGVYADANSVAEHIEQQKKLRGKSGLSQAERVQIEQNIKSDRELLSGRLQKLSETKRAKVLERMPTFKVMFEADGTIKAEQKAALDAKIKAAGDNTYNAEIRSSTASAERITEALKNGSTKNHEMRAYTGPLTEAQRKNVDDVREVMGAVSERSGEAIGDFVIAEKSPDGPAYFDETTGLMVIGMDAVENGTAAEEITRALEKAGWQEAVVHETWHGIENTKTGELLLKHIESNDALHTLATQDFLSRDYDTEFFGKSKAEAEKKLRALIAKAKSGETLTDAEQEAYDDYRSEVGGFANQRLFGNKAFMKKLITTEPSTAEKLIGKIREMREDLKVRKDPEAREQLDFVRKAEKLFMQGLSEAGGTIDSNGKIHLANREEDKEKNPAEGEVRWNLHRTRNMSWKKQIKGFLEGTGAINRSDTFTVGNPSLLLQSKGISAKPLAVPLSVITKAKNGKDPSHSIEDGNLEKLQAGIQNAPIIIDNPARNALVYVTNIRQNGKPVLIAFQKDVSFDGDDVHKATSIHLQMNVESMLISLPPTATIYAKNKSEFDAAVGVTNNLRSLAAHIEFTDNIIAQNSEKSTPSAQKNSGKVKRLMAGTKARTADKMKLATAQQMTAEGVDSETVRRETGWFQGYDGEWRFEIDDSQMEFSREGYGINELEKLMREEKELVTEIIYNELENPDRDISKLHARREALVEKMKNTPAVTLPFYVKHDALFEAYPELRQVKVVLKPRGYSGGYAIKENEIRIDSRFSDEEIKEALLHEMQHAVQRTEGFSGGANTTYWADKMGEADPEAYDRAVDRLSRAYKRLVERSSDAFLAKVKAFWRLAPKNKTQKYSPQAKALFDELMEHDEGDRFYDYVYALQTKQELDDRFGENNPYDMYLRTAGEVEARDTARRISLTAEQRKDIRPDIDRTNVLFADKESVFFGKKTTDFDKIILPDDVKYLGNRVDDYMAFRGWAEGILSAEDRQLLRERIADIKIRGYQGHIQLADGALLLDVNNKIVLVSGDFNDPVYDAVIDISADTETEASYFKEVFLGEFQRQQYSLRECNEFVEALLGEKYVKIYNRTNYLSSDGSQIQSLPTREKTRRDYGYSENQQYGRRGSRKITERHFNDDGSVTLTYSDKSTEIEPSKPQKGKVKMSRRAGETVTLSKGQIAALRANYEGDKVFTKKEVAAAISTIDALQKLPAAIRNELVTHLWRGYNERLNEQGFEQFTEIMWHRIHAEILQENGFEMSEDEIAAMDEQIVNALEQIVKSGKPSVRARLESATSTEGYRRQADFWRGEHSKAVQRNKQLNSLKFELEKLANQKKGLYVNAANYHGDDFKVAIDELAKMNWRGGLVSDTKIRERFAKLAAWYTKDNPLYKGDGGTGSLFRQEIADVLNSLGNSQNGALSVEDLQAAVTVAKYFAHEIEAHNTVFKDGKRVDAMPEAKDYIEKARRAKEIAAKCGIWSNLMRSKFARMVADPAMLMRQADGYLSGFFTEQYEALRQGTIDAAVLERELSEEFEKFWEEHKVYAKRYNDATVKFGDTEMPLQEGLSLFMTMKREHAFAGLAGAGFEIDGKEAIENISNGFADEVNRQLAEDWKTLPPEELLTLTKKKNAEMERSALKTVIEKKRQALYDQFTAEDRELIALMERAFEQCRDVKVRIDEIVQGYSNVTGGYYYPIKRTGLAENVDAYTGFEGDRVTNLSMNKETVKNAQKLLIEPAHIVFMRHLKATSLYHGLGVFTDNFNRLYNLDITGPVGTQMRSKEPQHYFESYTEKQKSNWANAKRIVICESGRQYRDFIRNARADSQNNKKMYFGIVTQEVATRIQKETNIDVSGFNCSLSAYEIRKIFKDHGNETRENTRGQRAMKENDVFLIPEVMGEPDSITKSEKDYNGKPVITFVKTIDGERHTVSAVVSNDHLDLFVQTAFVGIKKGGLATPTGEQAPINTPEASSGTASDSSISQKASSVNTEELKNYRGGPKTVRDALGQSNKFTQEMVKYFKELKQDVEGISKKRSQEKGYNDAVAFIRSMYATYQLGANPKVWVTQLSSLIAATNIIDADCLAKGLSVSGKDVDEFCRLAWLRNNDSSAAQAQAVGTSQNAVQRASRNVLQKVRDVAMLPIGKVDRLVITRLFGACQVQIEKQGGAKVGTKENKIEAGKLLQRVILETQQNSLATERSAAMRSGDELLKGFTMFSADAMKVGARFVDAFGELSVLRTLYREAKKTGNSKDMARLEDEIKRARKQCVRATVSLVGVALFNAALAYGFKWLYRRDEDESLASFIADTFGNMLGGIPFVRDLWSFFQDGFEMDHFLISTVNDVLGTVSASFELVSDAASGKEITRQQVLANMRKVVYAAGQLSGVPTRNLYNFTTGVINRVSPEAGYAVESRFFKQSYASDLQKALDAGDDKMVGTIAGLMIDEKIGIEDAAMRKTLQDLTSKGYKVLPRSVGDSVTVDGETVELTGSQQKKLREVYAIGQDAVADMVKLKQFAEADEKVQAAAIKFIYDVYWDLALEDALGVDLAEKNVLFAEAIDIEKLAVIVAMARSIEADKDKNGKAISGTKKRKVQTFVNSLRLSAAEKYMVMGYLGYTNVNGEQQVMAYINKLNLNQYEKIALREYCGYSLSSKDRKKMYTYTQKDKYAPYGG